MLEVLDARCRGSEHIKANKPLQDYSGSKLDRQKKIAYILVADGHGGEKYFRSAAGSYQAVYSCIEVMNTVLIELYPFIKRKDTTVINKTLNNLCSRILVLWREKVKVHFLENPLTDIEKKLCEELKIELPLTDDNISTIYGSTLLASVYFENYNFWFSLQIGDGKTIAMKTDNTVFYPIPEDDEMGFGVTASLCGRNAIDKFYYNYGFDKLNYIFVMSDGMADSFDIEKLPDFLLNIKNNAVVDIEKTKAELDDYLPKLSEQGSGDDISIAGIFVKEGKSNTKSLLNFFARKSKEI